MATPGDWIVTFEFNQRPRRLETPFTEQWTFEDLKGGFWINADHQLCRQGQGHYWIPPSRIMMIQPQGKQM